jgi:AcrR family transcriptional regulator
MNELVHSARVNKPDKAAKKPLVRAAPKPAPAPRTNDPARTMAGILEVATTEFAAKGLSGARIDAIAAATRTSKRMIYYYFGSKEGLYVAVLEEAYRRMRRIEAEQHLEDLAPEAALRRLVEFTFDHHSGNPDYIRLVMTENMERGAYLAQSKTIQELNVPAIQAIARLYERGVAEGVFRPGLDPIDIHASISALTFFNVSNQHTFGLIFKEDARTAQAVAARRSSITEMVVRFVRR